MSSMHQLSPEESAVFFEHRFRFAGRGHPAVEAMFDLAMEWIPAQNVTVPAVTAVPDPSAPAVPSALSAAALPPAPDPVDIVQMEVRLPPMPAVLLELQEIIHRPDVSATAIADVIAKDPGLAAWLLKLVNSPYYGFSAKVATISRAVTLVGTRQIQILSMGGALNSLAVLLPKGLMDMDRFWQHSMATGIAAQEIWRLTGRAEGEQLFVAGLLHDCGKLAMVYAAPKISQFLRSSPNFSSKPSYLAEKEYLGFDHARLGGMLMHRWNMPLPLVIAILRHHDVEDPGRYPEAACVHVANILVTALGLTLDEGTPVPTLNHAAWDVLGLAPQKLAFVAGTLRTRLESLLSTVQG
ncbi:HDOD domain-containing protein [Desulfovibrio sp. OttesenSCG-928-I05]|nr:HDOD domain-containing protein [Desulfovibrio sp. OttesenSCG-928-I05]